MPGRDGQVDTGWDSREVGITNFGLLDRAHLHPGSYLQERSRASSKVGDTDDRRGIFFRTIHRDNSTA